MKMLVNKSTHEIIHICENVEVKENGFDVGGLIYAYSPDIEIVEVSEIPQEVSPAKYIYEYENGEFKPNPNYVEPINPEQEIRNLKEQILTLQTTILELLGV